MTAYQKLLLDYAEVLQYYSYSGPLISKVLEDRRVKYDQHAQNNPRMVEKYEFWAKVTDVFMSNSRYLLFETFKQGEHAAKNDPEYIRKIIYLKQKRHHLK